MDIIAIGELLVVGLLVATIAGVPLFILYGIRAVLHKPRPPDCYGIFTENEATALFALKERYNETEELQR